MVLMHDVISCWAYLQCTEHAQVCLTCMPSQVCSDTLAHMLPAPSALMWKGQMPIIASACLSQAHTGISLTIGPPNRGRTRSGAIACGGSPMTKLNSRFMSEATAPPAGRVSSGCISNGYSHPRGPPVMSQPLLNTCCTGIKSCITSSEAACFNMTRLQVRQHRGLQCQTAGSKGTNGDARAVSSWSSNDTFCESCRRGRLTGPGVGRVKQKDECQSIPSQPSGGWHHL